MTSLRPHRLSGAGSARVDPAAPVPFTLDGRHLTAASGDTVASAMLANGIRRCGPSIYLNRPRGIVAAGVEEPNALVTVTVPGAVSETMLPATTVPVTAGMAVTTLSGVGVLDPRADDAYFDHVHAHTDVLVIGAGYAGLTAARAARRAGARTILLDERLEPGGALLDDPAQPIDGGATARAWVDAVVADLAAADDVEHLQRTTAIGSYDANYVVAVQRRTGGHRPGAGHWHERVWHIRAGRVILATGAHERPLVFANNDRPGVMLAGAVRSYRNRYAVACGRAVAIATTNDSVYPLARELSADGTLVAVIDARPEPTAAARAARDLGIRVLSGRAVAGLPQHDPHHEGDAGNRRQGEQRGAHPQRHGREHGEQCCRDRWVRERQMPTL